MAGIIIFFLALALNMGGDFLGAAAVYAQPDSKSVCSNEIAVLKKKNKDMESQLLKEVNLNRQLENKAKALYLESLEAQSFKKELRDAQDIIASLTKERLDFKKQNESFQEKIVSLEQTLNNERAGFYRELGAAYSGAGNFKKAIEAYNQSLKYDSVNAKVYYCLGLIYKHDLDDSRKAVENFKKYLHYEPEAQDRKEVEYFIKMLSE